jgi:hypothetical protein
MWLLTLKKPSANYNSPIAKLGEQFAPGASTGALFKARRPSASCSRAVIEQ